jgi:hypothetical protein
VGPSKVMHLLGRVSLPTSSEAKLFIRIERVDQGVVSSRYLHPSKCREVSFLDGTMGRAVLHIFFTRRNEVPVYVDNGVVRVC